MLFGLVYPLVITGVSQVLFPDKADGCRIERDGELVGSRLIAQDFRSTRFRSRSGKFGKKAIKAPDPRYFQPRPSVTGYDPSVTFFNNLGPNNKELSQQFGDTWTAYLALEGPTTPG